MKEMKGLMNHRGNRYLCHEALENRTTEEGDSVFAVVMETDQSTRNCRQRIGPKQAEVVGALTTPGVESGEPDQAERGVDGLQCSVTPEANNKE
ncbi:hypothetical protein COCON_G00052660 [Conger conger]|uniref:Uncharacterized protein n=1 Tax=Conger conger TaxID=82655 RepID=A0A9Q1I3Y8_CONCO|nr:hypothetical protein COCON_G00052660 [Conger conger]